MSVGFPACLWLDEFGAKINDAFGDYPFHVGSSLKNKSEWRDVDVRLLLDDDVYEAMGLGHPERPHENGKWKSLCQAYCVLGEKMTGLPIDFQIQQRTWANTTFPEPANRSALGILRNIARMEQR